MAWGWPDVPPATESELRLVAVYLATGSTKGAAARLGITDEAYRWRLGRVYRRHGVCNMAQLVWRLRDDLAERETSRMPL